MGLMHSLLTCLAREAHDAIVMDVTSRSRTRRIEDQNKSRDIECG